MARRRLAMQKNRAGTKRSRPTSILRTDNSELKLKLTSLYASTLITTRRFCARP